MNRYAFGLLIALSMAGCAREPRAIDQVQPGMNHEQVVALIGQPEGQARVNDRDCALYTVQKDFWRRTPWSMSDHYQVCYTGNQVQTFGRTFSGS